MRPSTFTARRLMLVFIGAGLCAFASGRAAAQIDFGILSKGAGGAAAPVVTPVTLSARLAPAEKDQPARIVVAADVAAGWHIYSLTQERGGPIPSKLALEPNASYKLAGEFSSSTPPEVTLEPVFNNLPVETHEGNVVWSAPLALTPGADLVSLSIEGKLSFQACNASSCLPPTVLKFTAKFGPPLARETAAGAAQDTNADRGGQAGLRDNASAPGTSDLHAAIGADYKPSNAHVILRGYVEPQQAAPGDKVRLVITAEPVGGYHIYALAPRDPQKGSKPTLITLSQANNWVASPPVADSQPIEKPSAAFPGTVERYYEQPVTFSVDLEVPKDAPARAYELAGTIGFQTCREETGCDMPQAAAFSATLPVALPSIAGRIPLLFAAASSYSQVAKAVAGTAASATVTARATGVDLTQLRPTGATSGKQSLLIMLATGFLGGMILNLMPCVLPVIGLKILSFVEQSGQDRRRILFLNGWYAAGILAVFMVLATLPVAYHLFQEKQFGWGQQFAYDGFNITLTAVVFAMALSFLGVWEIPIPGFVGGSKANELASQEGAAGAFAKGALTTVLATPCSGPFLTSALIFAVAEPPHITYAIFLCIGLGMASPYLLIGAFPRLIHFLPKPGAWMDTFKQAMGFVLLGTVVYLLTLIQGPLLVPTVALLMGLWAGCWWIGRTPLYAELGVKLRAWLIGAVCATLVGLLAFNWIGPIMEGRFQLAIDRRVEEQIRSMGAATTQQPSRQQSHGEFELPWEPYSLAKLEELTRAGKTVMLDFTADWCATCQTLKVFVLDTEETRKLVEANGVVPLLVDMTRFPPQEAELLQALAGAQLLPVLAIFPAGRPNAPIVLSNTYTQGILLEKLREAGPSKGEAQRTALNAPR